MGRSRATARKAGSAFERSIADCLASALDDDRIDRRVKRGSADRGDIGGVRIHGQRLVIECKDVRTQARPEWTREAQLEAGNDDALAGVVVHKRRGTREPLDQWVSMTVRELVALISGQRSEP